jgi:hypothetical protein
MKRRQDFLLQDVAGEKLLVPLGAQVMDLNGLVILNDTAACVWTLLEQERSLDELSAALADRFDVGLETAAADIRTFIDEARRQGLLEQ